MKAWNEIDTAIIIKAFKKCGISNALDGSEDDILYQDDESDSDPFADLDEDHAEECEEMEHDDVV